jgi:tetratricopeptide (TPR) repeat protein
MTEKGALVLEVLKQDSHLKQTVFEQTELAHTLRHYSQVSFSSTEIDKLCQEVITILNKVGKKYTLEPEAVNTLKKTTQLLWDHLLSRAVKEKLKATKIRDLILSIDEELIHIPWELLYTGDNFLCLKFNLGRVIRTQEKEDLPQYRSMAHLPKMLILANPTNNLKSAYREGLYIKNQFDKKRKEIAIDFKSTHIDTLYVKKNLRDYDIVHFAGHCEYDNDNYKHSGWVLSDGRFTAEDILILGESLSLPGLIFSHACQSAQGYAEDLMDIDYQKKTYNLASAFLFSGVRHYIGTVRKIEDQISFQFAKEFYTHLLYGNSVGESLRLSRLKLIKEYGLAAIQWMSYLLYGDPSFVLFPAKAILPKFPHIFRFSKKQIRRSALVIAIISLCVYLYMWMPTLNPTDYFLFMQARKLFLQGKNQAVISTANRLIQNKPDFLAIYPLLADTYQRLGKREQALKYYFTYALNSEKKNEKKHLANAYIGIAWIYHLQGEYPKAFNFYNTAINLARENQDKLNEATALRKLAVWYTDNENYDKALELLTKSSEINRERQHIYAHRYNLACDYFDLGWVFTNKDDFSTAKEFYAKSQHLFKKLKLKNELSDYYFNLGEIYLLDKQYQKALDCYAQGLAIDQRQGNLPSLASDYNMLGELYIEMDNLLEAEKSFNQAISIAKDIDAPLELADAYYNLGELYRQKGQKNKAREYLRLVQEIYARLKHPDYEKVKEEFLE